MKSCQKGTDVLLFRTEDRIIIFTSHKSILSLLCLFILVFDIDYFSKKRTELLELAARSCELFVMSMK